jgi:hypothetical protein
LAVAKTEGLAGPQSLQENCFSSPSLNNIYIFSLNSKTIEILLPLILFSGSTPVPWSFSVF